MGLGAEGRGGTLEVEAVEEGLRPAVASDFGGCAAGRVVAAAAERRVLMIEIGNRAFPGKFHFLRQD